MPGGLFGGGPVGAGTSGTPSNNQAQSYQPQGQPAADTSYQNLINQLYGAYSSGQTPSQVNYATAQPYAQNYQNLYSQTANNPYYPQAIQNELTSQGIYANVGNQLSPDVGPLAQGASSLLSSAFSPYINQAMTGANAGAGYGQTGAGNAAGASQNAFEIGGALFPAAQAYSGLTSNAAQPLQGVAQSLLSTGFDPLNANYNRLVQQTTDAANAANAASGVGSTPYGASVTANAVGNLNLNWDQNLLNRELQAASGAGNVQNTIGGLYNQAGGILNQGANAADITYGTGLSLGQGATGLAASSAALPEQTWQAYLQNAGANLGTSGQILEQGGAIGNAAAQAQQQAALAPYGLYQQNLTQQGQGLNQLLSGLSGISNLGQSQYQLPEDVLNYLGNYLRLGQGASELSGILGGQGVNQATQGLGALAGLGSLGYSSGAFGALGSGIGGLFGGSADASALASVPGVSAFPSYLDPSLYAVDALGLG